MATIRIEKTKNYTIMGNYHLRDRNLSNKARGLLSTMLSLPDEWDYTVRGLASICKDGVDGITAQLKELELAGYLERVKVRDEQGRLRNVDYTVYEKPRPRPPTQSNPASPDPALPDTETPDTVFPDTGLPDTAFPDTENPAQINTNLNKILTELRTDLPTSYREETGVEALGCGLLSYQEAKAQFQAAIEYDIIRDRYDRTRLDELVELAAEALSSRKETFAIGGESYPAELVRNRLLSLTAIHVEYIFDYMDRMTSPIYNIKKYLLSVMINAPVTMDSYYANRVRSDWKRDSG